MPPTIALKSGTYGDRRLEHLVLGQCGGPATGIDAGLGTVPDTIVRHPCEDDQMASVLPDWMWFALGSAFFAGLTAIFGKVGVAGIPSNLATFLRTIVVVLFAGAIVAARGEWQNPVRLPPRALTFLFLSALATGGSWLCYYRALQLGPASKVAPVDKLGVVFAVILAFLFLHERADLRTIGGCSLIVGGAVLMALK